MVEGFHSHTQSVERAVKMITETSSLSCDPEKRNGFTEENFTEESVEKKRYEK